MLLHRSNDAPPRSNGAPPQAHRCSFFDHRCASEGQACSSAGATMPLRGPMARCRNRSIATRSASRVPERGLFAPLTPLHCQWNCCDTTSTGNIADAGAIVSVRDRHPYDLSPAVARGCCFRPTTLPLFLPAARQNVANRCLVRSELPSRVAMISLSTNHYHPTLSSNAFHGGVLQFTGSAHVHGINCFEPPP